MNITLKVRMNIMFTWCITDNLVPYSLLTPKFTGILLWISKWSCFKYNTFFICVLHDLAPYSRLCYCFWCVLVLRKGEVWCILYLFVSGAIEGLP